MKKILGITFGGFQRRAVNLAMTMLILAVVLFSGIFIYQSKMLVDVVEDTRTQQQKAISETSEGTMFQVMEASLTEITSLQANLADADFSEVMNDIYMLQTIAEGIMDNRENMQYLTVNPPDPALNGTTSAMVLYEEGVDYTKSEYLGIIANMSGPMIAMQKNSEKIDSCYIGLADGTHLCVDEKSAIKCDENGVQKYFPVRQRPWYVNAAETGELYFTGIMEDAFSGIPVITVSAPVVSRGETIGVVGIDVILSSMSDFINTSSKSTSAYIINEHGQVVLGPEDGIFEIGETEQAEDLRTLGNEDLTKFIDESLAGKTGLALIDLDGKTYYMAGAPLPTVGWALISLVDKEITEQPEKLMLAEYDRINDEASARFHVGTYRTRGTALVLLALVIAIGLLVALVAAKRMARPIELITQKIVHTGKTGELFRMEDCFRTNDEIELLAEAFDDLSRKTKKYIEEITKITKEKERVSTELQMANLIQVSMLPHIFPAFPERKEFDLYASMDPAKEVGGDFYDFFLIDADHLCMVMADVSGKGIPAALFMMISKVILQSCAMLGQSTAEILNKTNEALCTNNQVEMFVTVWLGIMEISTGKITAANAGHEYPVVKKGGKFHMLKDKHGFVVGGLDGVKYKEYEILMEPGDKLFLYTDGVPEATDADSNMFGTDRMLEALNLDPEGAPDQILKNVRCSVDEFVKDAEQFDDLTMLCMEYNGPENKVRTAGLSVHAQGGDTDQEE